MKMKNLTFALFLSINLAPACSSQTTGGDTADLAAPAAGPDLSVPAADLASPKDLSVPPDLTVLLPSCSDGQKNGSETDRDCGGTCAPCAVGAQCVQASDCASMRCAGTCQSDLGTMRNPATSCQAILSAGASTGDGAYYLTAADTTLHVYCDMTRDGGGWALLIRARKAAAAGWSTTGALNAGELAALVGTKSAKASDAVINAVRKTGYRVESTNCAGGAVASTVFFKPACVYQHNTDTSGDCQTSYATADFNGAATVGEQFGRYQGLNSYTTATRGTTAIIVHDPASGLGDDSWWSGGPNACDVNGWVR